MQSYKERRHKDRYKLRLQVELRPAGSGCSYHARTVNVNAAGMLFAVDSRDPVDFCPGKSFQFNLELADTPDGGRSLVEGTGQVVRVDQRHRIASIFSRWRLEHQAADAPPLPLGQRTS